MWIFPVRKLSSPEGNSSSETRMQHMVWLPWSTSTRYAYVQADGAIVTIFTIFTSQTEEARIARGFFREISYVN